MTIGKLMRMALIITMGAIWVTVIHREPFRSHYLLTTLSAGACAVFVGAILGLTGRRLNNPTPDERIAALREVKRQYPAMAVRFTIVGLWMISIGGQTFGSLRSHLWLIVLGVIASAGIWWAAPALIRRWWHDGAT